MNRGDNEMWTIVIIGDAPEFHCNDGLSMKI